MLIDFDPNETNKPQAPQWATYFPDRAPKFKVHTHRGHALNAFQERSTGILYEYLDNKWIERIQLSGDRRPSSCGRCGRECYPSRKFTIDDSTATSEWLCHPCKHPRHAARMAAALARRQALRGS